MAANLAVTWAAGKPGNALVTRRPSLYTARFTVKGDARVSGPLGMPGRRPDIRDPRFQGGAQR